jgi:hypothetical protein
MTLDRRVMGPLGRVRRTIFAAHRADLNFTGCGIGFRRHGGHVTDEPVVIAMVVRKRPEASISRMRLLPRTIDVDGRAWGVDVVEVGPLTATGLTSVPLADAAVAPQADGLAPDTPITQQLVRPPKLGCSISNFNSGPVGTLGCFATDNTDGTVCVVSSAHVLARYGAAKTGELIVQPALADNGVEADGIASLKRFVPVGSSTNYVDVGLALLTDQGAYSTDVVGGFMSPISPSHPAVGMVVADDSAACGENCFLSRMDRTISQLNVSLIGSTSSSTAVVAPQVGMHIEKVGRTSEYTSTFVDAIGAQIKVNYGGTTVTFSDMIWTQAMSLGGDSGAVACKGGNGTTYAPLPPWCTNPSPCALVDAFATYYNLPLTTSANLTIADEIRDHFLAMSNTGQLLIGVTYLNAQTAIDRLNANTGSAHNQAVAQAVALTLYNQYHDLVAKLAASPSPTATVTSSEVNAAASVLFGLAAPVSAGGTAMLTAAESSAAWTLFSDIIKPTVGMDRTQLINYMNESATYQKVRDQLAAIPTIRLRGALSAD